MKAFAKVLIGLLVIVHIGFFVAEMFFWSTPAVQSRVDKFTLEQLAAILASNQGLSNGILAAGLVWGLFPNQARSIWGFLLPSIAIAGIYGSISLKSPYPIVLQTFPAILALLLLWLVGRTDTPNNLQRSVKDQAR